MNLLMIIADQHLATCLGHEGHSQVITPNLDRLAASGMRFNNAYTQSPICTPSRVSLLSGQYCHNHGYFGLSGPAPENLPSFLGHVRSHGHRAAAIGNIHVPNDPRNWLDGHVDKFLDYDVSVDSRRLNTPFYDMLRKLGLEKMEDMAFVEAHPEYVLEGFPSKLPFEKSQEGWSVDEAIKFMDGSRGKAPFCIQVSLQRPHQPFLPDQQFWDMYPDDLRVPDTLNQDPRGRPPHFQAEYEWFRSMNWQIEPRTFEAGVQRLWHGYLACITHVDHAVGVLLDYLEETGLADNTAVVYTADHGGYSGTYGIPEKTPGICSDAVCRVPLIWRVPNVTAPGSVCGNFVEHVDMAPTIAALCGAPPMETVDGIDLTGLLGGKTTASKLRAVTENPWSKAIRWGAWRFVHYQPEMFSDDVGELYNLETDPNETSNLYQDEAHQHIVNKSRRMLLEFLISSRRIKTAWPVQNPKSLPYDYHTAADGTIANGAGVAQRAANGDLNYL